MKGVFAPGDTLELEAVPFSELRPGDIVAIDAERPYVHRVIRIEKDRIITQGDNNPHPDEQPLTPDRSFQKVTGPPHLTVLPAASVRERMGSRISGIISAAAVSAPRSWPFPGISDECFPGVSNSATAWTSKGRLLWALRPHRRPPKSGGHVPFPQTVLPSFFRLPKEGE